MSPEPQEEIKKEELVEKEGERREEEREEVENRWTIMIITAHGPHSLNRNKRKASEQLFVSWMNDQIKRTSRL